MSKPLGETPLDELADFYDRLQKAQLDAIESCNELLRHRKDWAYVLGSIITHWREIPRNRQQDLAKLLGVQTQEVSQAERGRRSSVLPIIQAMLVKNLIRGTFQKMEIPQEYFRKDQRVCKLDDGQVRLLPLN